MGEKLSMTVDVQPMRMPAYVTAYALGQEIKLDVGGLSEADVSLLWDQWKALWLDHCAKRRESRNAEPPVEHVEPLPASPGNGNSSHE